MFEYNTTWLRIIYCTWLRCQVCGYVAAYHLLYVAAVPGVWLRIIYCTWLRCQVCGYVGLVPGVCCVWLRGPGTDGVCCAWYVEDPSDGPWWLYPQPGPHIVLHVVDHTFLVSRC